MKYANDYRLGFHRLDDGGFSFLIPTGLEDRNTVIKKQKDIYGSVEITEFGLDDFIANIPPDRKLRNAWQLTSQGIIEDIVKSREIIKKGRNEILNLLDKCAWKEQRKPDGDILSIDQRAQLLRDLPSREEFLNGTIQDLKDMHNEIEIARHFSNQHLWS